MIEKENPGYLHEDMEFYKRKCAEAQEYLKKINIHREGVEKEIAVYVRDLKSLGWTDCTIGISVECIATIIVCGIVRGVDEIVAKKQRI